MIRSSKFIRQPAAEPRYADHAAAAARAAALNGVYAQCPVSPIWG